MRESTMKGFEIIDGVVPGRRRFIEICVEGYDTSLHEYDLKLALTKHFSSCGEIIHIYVPRNFEKGILQRYTFIRMVGEGALEKALQLSGSDVGGWRVFAKASNQEEITDPGWAAVSAKYYSSRREMVVTGYDTSLPEIDLQIGLSKHFSSCGEVIRVTIIKNESDGLCTSKAVISILGEGAVDKARKLSGRDMGGWNITVVMVIPPNDSRTIRRVSFCPFLPYKSKKMTEAESSLSLSQKNKKTKKNKTTKKTRVEFSLLGLGGD